MTSDDRHPSFRFITLRYNVHGICCAIHGNFVHVVNFDEAIFLFELLPFCIVFLKCFAKRDQQCSLTIRITRNARAFDLKTDSLAKDEDDSQNSSKLVSLVDFSIFCLKLYLERLKPVIASPKPFGGEQSSFTEKIRRLSKKCHKLVAMQFRESCDKMTLQHYLICFAFICSKVWFSWSEQSHNFNSIVSWRISLCILIWM